MAWEDRPDEPVCICGHTSDEHWRHDRRYPGELRCTVNDCNCDGYKDSEKFGFGLEPTA